MMKKAINAEQAPAGLSLEILRIDFIYFGEIIDIIQKYAGFHHMLQAAAGSFQLPDQRVQQL